MLPFIIKKMRILKEKKTRTHVSMYRYIIWNISGFLITHCTSDSCDIYNFIKNA